MLMLTHFLPPLFDNTGHKVHSWVNSILLFWFGEVSPRTWQTSPPLPADYLS